MKALILDSICHVMSTMRHCCLTFLVTFINIICINMLLFFFVSSILCFLYVDKVINITRHINCFFTHPKQNFLFLLWSLASFTKKTNNIRDSPNLPGMTLVKKKKKEVFHHLQMESDSITLVDRIKGNVKVNGKSHPLWCVVFKSF